MTRIATSTMIEFSRNDIMRAQQELVQAQTSVSTGKVATDVAGYGGDAQALIGTSRMVAQAEGYIDVNREAQTRLQLQDVELERQASAINELSETLLESLALGDLGAIPNAIDDTFATLQSSMNTTLGGRYIFGGARDDVPPVTADAIGDITGGAGADALQADGRKGYLQIDESTRVETNPLPQDYAVGGFEALRELEDFNIGPNGPFEGAPDTATSDFISGIIQDLEAAYQEILNAQASNGQILAEVEQTEITQTARRDMLEASVGDMSDVDLAEAAVELTAAQTQFEATAQAFNTVQGLSLLNFLN